jgi:hypothetical protein
MLTLINPVERAESLAMLIGFLKLSSTGCNVSSICGAAAQAAQGYACAAQ